MKYNKIINECTILTDSKILNVLIWKDLSSKFHFDSYVIVHVPFWDFEWNFLYPSDILDTKMIKFSCENFSRYSFVGKWGL